MVPIVEAMLRLRNQERTAHAVRQRMDLLKLWRAQPERPERRHLTWKSPGLGFPVSGRGGHGDRVRPAMPGWSVKRQPGLFYRPFLIREAG